MTPAINTKIQERAFAIMKANNQTGQKDFNKAFNQAIKEAGYSVPKYHKTMKSLYGGSNEDNF